MASSKADSDQASGPNSFNLETTMPLRESKTSLGPFRATQIWKEMIHHMKSKVELKRRRYKMRYYDNCFTGNDAVDVILHYLLSDKDTFSADLTREKAVKVCQLLMSRKAFEAVGARQCTKPSFEDSGGKLYCFPVDTSPTPTPTPNDTENVAPSVDDSDDDSLYDDSDNPLSSDSKRCTFPLESMGDCAGDREADARSCSSLTSLSSYCSSSASLPETDCLDHTANLSPDVIKDTWREVALAQLTTLIDLTFLDGVLAVNKLPKRSTSNQNHHPHHNHPHHHQQRHGLVISNVVAQHWHRPLTQSLLNLNQVGLDGEQECDVLHTAIACIQGLPKGSCLLAEHRLVGQDSNTKREAFDLLRKQYSAQGQTILPPQFFDLHMAVLNLILQNHERQAVKALRLDMVLLPVEVKDELHRLLTFMAAIALDTSLVLDPTDSNEVVALRAFSGAIFRHKLLAPNLGSVLVQFLMQHLAKVFTVPTSLRDRVTRKLYTMQTGHTLTHSEPAFCQRVSTEEYARQSRDCTQEGLVSMVNAILDDTRIPLKDKQRRLKHFQKCYPTLYRQHFSGML